MPPKKLTPRGRAATPPQADEPPAPRKRTSTAKPKVSTKSSRRYVRSIRGVLTRTKFENGRNVTLNPRGQRGDMTAVSKEDMEDAAFLNNLDVMYELITAKDAEEIRQKQSTNQNAQRAHPSTALQDELGNPIEFGGTSSSAESQGITVARINNDDQRIPNLPNQERLDNVGPQQTVVPGSAGSEFNTRQMPPIVSD